MYKSMNLSRGLRCSLSGYRWIGISGLWSVTRLNRLPYRYWWNFLDAKNQSECLFLQLDINFLAGSQIMRSKCNWFFTPEIHGRWLHLCHMPKCQLPALLADLGCSVSKLSKMSVALWPTWILLNTLQSTSIYNLLVTAGWGGGGWWK